MTWRAVLFLPANCLIILMLKFSWHIFSNAKRIFDKCVDDSVIVDDLQLICAKKPQMTITSFLKAQIFYLQILPVLVDDQKSWLKVFYTITFNFHRWTFCQRSNVGETFELQMLECVVNYQSQLGDLELESFCHEDLHQVIHKYKSVEGQHQNIFILQRHSAARNVEALQLNLSDESASHLTQISILYLDSFHSLALLQLLGKV